MKNCSHDLGKLGLFIYILQKIQQHKNFLINKKRKMNNIKNKECILEKN